MSWIALEAAASCRLPMSNAARLTLFSLAHHQNHVTSECFPGYDSIADVAGISRRSVQNAIPELVDLGLIVVRDSEGVAGRGRPTHAYDLTFVADFRAERARRKQAKDADLVAKSADLVAAAASEPDSNQEKKDPPSPQGGRKARSKVEVSPEAQAVADRLWRLASVECRRKSGQDDTARATQAALARGATADELAVAVAAHCAEKGAEENGKWTKGLHRILEQDRWRTWYPDDARQVAAILAAERAASDDPDPDAPVDDIGTLEKPGPRRQRSWLEDWARNPYLWKVHVQGPAPGDEGCRCDPALLREFGAVPFGEA